MRRLLVLITMVFSLSACDIAFKSSFMTYADPGLTLDSTKLSTMTVAQIKSSLGPGFYKALRADKTAFDALGNNLKDKCTNLTGADQREALRITIAVIINATFVVDVLNRVPTDILPKLGTLSSATLADVQLVLKTIIGSDLSPTHLVEFWAYFNTLSNYMDTLNTKITDGSKFDAAALVEYFSDANVGDFAQAGMLCAYFNALNLGLGAPTLPTNFFLFMTDATPNVTFAGSAGAIATNYGLMDTLKSAGTPIALVGLRFFNQIQAKLPKI